MYDTVTKTRVPRAFNHLNASQASEVAYQLDREFGRNNWEIQTDHHSLAQTILTDWHLRVQQAWSQHVVINFGGYRLLIKSPMTLYPDQAFTTSSTTQTTSSTTQTTSSTTQTTSSTTRSKTLLLI